MKTNGSSPLYLQPEHLFQTHTNTAGFCFLVSVWTVRLSGESISVVWLTLVRFISQSCNRGASWETATTCPAASIAFLPTLFTSRHVSGKCIAAGLSMKEQLFKTLMFEGHSKGQRKVWWNPTQLNTKMITFQYGGTNEATFTEMFKQDEKVKNDKVYLLMSWKWHGDVRRANRKGLSSGDDEWVPSN